jgi:hypothetical protein
MEIAVLWKLSLDLLVRYRRERLGGRIALLVLLLACASLAGSACAGWTEFAGRLVLAATLVCQFRLWDDLCDLPRDRVHHPGRVLSMAPTLAPFQVLLAVLVGINLLLLGAWKPRIALFTFLALNTVLFLWYGVLRHLAAGARLNALVVLLKYPVFVYLLAATPEIPPGLSLAVAAALVYALLCVYEVWHDPQVRTVRSP